MERTLRRSVGFSHFCVGGTEIDDLPKRTIRCVQPNGQKTKIRGFVNIFLKSVDFFQPQKVDFLKMDSTYSWVYIEAADGTSGWFKIDVQVDGGVTVRIVDLDLKHWEVFMLYYAG